MKRMLPTLLALFLAPCLLRAADANEETEKAVKEATRAVAPCVVRIETSGGSETIAPKTPAAPAGPGQPPAPPPVRKGVGPTTGVIVDKEGYIISSAFNFANKPSDIFVSVPGHGRAVAKIVANDTTRMITLLKIETKEKNLPTPVAYPKKEVKLGQWTIALGRSLDPELDHMPSMSLGILSATNRITGKMFQTDAKVSPVNYGGPLVGIDGRVLGILVPASPRGEGETAGVDWYDGGIGFAVPMEDVYAILPRLKEGKELTRGQLGVAPRPNTDNYNGAAIIGTIPKGSAADKAGLKKGDEIVAFEGVSVSNFSQLQHLVGPKYEGDKVAIKVKRGGKELEFKDVVLSSIVAVVTTPYLGILPMRDDPDAGIEVRYVYPKSPAELGGIKAGDRIMKVTPNVVIEAAEPIMPEGDGPEHAQAPPRPARPVPAPAAPGAGLPITNRDQFVMLLSQIGVGNEAKLELLRKTGEKSETVTVTVKLTEAPQELLATELPLPSSAERAGEKPAAKKPEKKGDSDKKDEKKPEAGKKDEKKDDKMETGLLRPKDNLLRGREYWVYLPENYKKSVTHGVIVWFHGSTGKGGKDAAYMTKIWGDFCEKHHYIIVAPTAGGAEGWFASESEDVHNFLRAVLAKYSVDKNRVVVHGMGNGGQMALYFALHARDLVRGAVTTGAALKSNPKDQVQGQPLTFFLIGGDKDPTYPEIADTAKKLGDKKYPVIFRTLSEFGKEYLDEVSFKEIRIWIDSLDRI